MTPNDANTDHAAFQSQKLVEAALFSAGRPLSIQELAEHTNLRRGLVVQGLKDLRDELGSRITALEVIRAGEKYALQLKTEYAETVRLLVPAEVPKHVLKTLALIAYHQPIEQSELKDLVGSKVYEHTGTLEELGLIRKTPSGLTYELTTTPEFPEYFGIDGLQAKEIRAFLAEKLGLVTGREETPPAHPADAQTTLEDAGDTDEAEQPDNVDDAAGSEDDEAVAGHADDTADAPATSEAVDDGERSDDDGVVAEDGDETGPVLPEEDDAEPVEGPPAA